MKNSQHYCVTDIFLENEDKEILMINRGLDKDILPGFYNGLGGKIDQRETPLEAVLRETKEESGISKNKIKDVQLRAILTIKDKWGFWQIFIFQGKIRKQDLKKTEISEGKLEWVAPNQLNKIKLVPDLQSWLYKMYDDLTCFLFVKCEYDNQYGIKNIRVETV